MVEQVVGERGRRATVGAAGDIAPAIIAAGVDRPGLVGARRSGCVQTGQLMRLAAAIVEVLILRAAVERSLPELTQVGGDEGIAVAGA